MPVRSQYSRPLAASEYPPPGRPGDDATGLVCGSGGGTDARWGGGTICTTGAVPALGSVCVPVRRPKSGTVVEGVPDKWAGLPAASAANV